jgi:hypothetical protein
MTFRVIGDAIEYDGRTVGFLTVPPGTLREDVIKALSVCGPDQSERIAELEEEVDGLESIISEIKELCS